MMKTLQLKSGGTIPILGLGTWKAEEGEVYKAIRKAIEIGYRHFDCAFIYGNEAEIGEAISDSIKAGEVTRDQLWITSKLWNNAHKKDRVLPAIENTLKDLQLDYLDLYLIHWPVALSPEVTFPEQSTKNEFFTLDEIPLEETWEAMLQLKEAGLTKHVGVSNFSIQKIKTLSAVLEAPEVNQIEIHPYLNQNELVNFCKMNNIVLTGYKPLGSGATVTDSMQKNNQPALINNEIINKIADENQMTPAQVLISWQITREIAVIPKSTNPKRIEENYNSKNYKLSDQQMTAINQLNWNHRYVDAEKFCENESPYTTEFIFK